MFEHVQGIIDGRNTRKAGRASANEFAFSGLVGCGHCGCAMVGEIKKGRYVYYHCTGYKGKCPEPYAREEALSQHFSTALRRLHIGDHVFAWLSKGFMKAT